MSDTPVTLLDRLRGRPTPADWDRFHALYAPLLMRWLARVPGLGDEANDVTQEVLTAVIRDVAGFEHRHGGSFRAWLRAITVNRVRAHWKARDRDLIKRQSA